MAEQQTQLLEFCKITGSTEENAKFYLEATEWNVQLALLYFYELSSDSASGQVQAIKDNDMSAIVPETGREKLLTPKKSKVEYSSMTSIRENNNSDASSADEMQAFYAGGSVSSGQQILGGPRNDANLIMDMFHAAHRSSFAVDDTTGLNDTMFQGQGHRLGAVQENEINSQIRNNVEGLVDMVLRVWSDGFTVDDGPLRNLNNSDDREFLHMVTTGQVPPEIAPPNGSAVRLKVEDHRFEVFKRRSKKQLPFSGEGHTLGSTMEDSSANQNIEMKSENDLKAEIPIDNNLPVTTVQVRLNDGRRLQVTLNYHHTIGDIRNYISTLVPEYTSGNFRLVTSFPSKELDDNNATVEQAGILNSSILLRG